MDTISQIEKKGSIPAKIGDEPPKGMWLHDVVSSYSEDLPLPADFFETGRGTIGKIKEGIYEGVRSLSDIPEQIMILGGRAQILYGGYFNDPEKIERGRLNIATMRKNLNTLQMERSRYSTSKERDSFSYQLGAGVSNYGTMALGGVLGILGKSSRLANVGSLGVMGAMELGGELQEGADVHVRKTGDESFNEYTGQQALKDTIADLGYTAGSVVLEKFVGFGKQTKMWIDDASKVKKIVESGKWGAVKSGLKIAGKSSISETVTETAQSFLNMGIDVANGRMDLTEVPERVQQEMMGWAVASVIGFTAGGASATYNRQRGIRHIKQELSSVVPPDELDTIAKAIFDTGAEKMAEILSVELALSSELQNKHGAVYDSMAGAINNAIVESGAFANLSEDERAEYTNDTAKLFADQVLAEANHRGVTIDEVLKATDIVYEDGGIKLKDKRGDGNINPMYLSKDEGSENVKYEQAMYRSPKDNIGDFVDGVENMDTGKKSYFQYKTKDDVLLDIPSDTILHDKNKHDLKKEDWENLLNNIENIENWTESSYSTTQGKALLLKVRAGDNVYGVTIEHTKNGRNIVTTAFKSTDKGIDTWIKRETAKTLPSHPIASESKTPSVAPLSRSLKHIIASLTDKVNPLFQSSNNPKGSYNPNQKFYQSEDAFKPTKQEVSKYNEDLNKAIKGELPSKQSLRLGKTPEIYTSLGLEQKPLIMSQNVLKKINVGKHDVGLDVIEKLPELMSEPTMVFSSKTQEGSLVSVLDAVDGSERVVVAVVTPTEGKFNVIPTVYGRNDFKKFIQRNIEEGNLKYFDKEKASKLLRRQGLQLPKWEQLKSYTDNILQKEDIVNTFLQKNNRNNPKGSYNPNQGLIKIFEGADFSTLPHEIAHYWLDNMWSYVRSGQASEGYQQRWNTIANWLKVTPEQSYLTRGQQEKFARGYEQFLKDGKIPVPMMAGIFNDYDKWLKRVYGDLQVQRLSDDAVRFFQSMTSGELPPPVIKPKTKAVKSAFAQRLEGLKDGNGGNIAETVESSIEEDIEIVKEVISTSEAQRGTPNREDIAARTMFTSNINEGEKGISRVYSRETRKLSNQLEAEDVGRETYNKTTLAEQSEKATSFVQENLAEARKVIDGLAPAPDGILDTAIRIAYEQEMLRIGDNAEYLRALKIHSLSQTLRGQEIAAERIITDDLTSPSYWIDKVIQNRAEKVASKVATNWADPSTWLDSKRKLQEKVIEDIETVMDKVLAEETVEGQNRVLQGEIKRIRREYKAEELYQTELATPLTRQNARIMIDGIVRDAAGLSVSQAEANQIIGKVDELFKSSMNTTDSNGNPSVETWKKADELNKMTEAMSPSNVLSIATSTVGRAMMLASFKSPALNIISNMENLVTEGLTNRVLNKAFGKSIVSEVDSSVIKDYIKYSWEVYKASGINVSTSSGVGFDKMVLGEKTITTQGEGKYRAFARAVETGIFKYSMGAPDSRSKDVAFCDSASLEATSIAVKEGKQGQEIANRATELFRDAILVNPMTEEGRAIRKQAMVDAHVATYTNDSNLSKFALGIRGGLNKVSGPFRLGDQAMPFVKTPANVLDLGIQYSAGVLYAIPHIKTIVADFKVGELSQETKQAIRAAVRNGLGMVLATVLLSMIDDDDYIPDYASSTEAERKLIREKNAVHNSIKIGGKYVSLDYFGPLAVPLTAMLTARKRKGNPIIHYALGLSTQTFKLPGLKEAQGILKTWDDLGKTNPDKIQEEFANIAIDFLRSRTVPSIVNDIAKMMDDYERDTRGDVFGRVKASIPFIRETLPVKQGMLSATPVETEGALSTLFFGSRVKGANDSSVIREIDRLIDAGHGVTINDVTDNGSLLSTLSFEKKQKARRLFAKEYTKNVRAEIQKGSYRSQSNEEKASILNGIRKKATEKVKKEMGIERKKKK
jgi:hypothetical protein